MKMKYPLCLLLLALTSSVFGQATLSVDGFARIAEKLSIGSDVKVVQLEVNDTDGDTDVLLDFNTTGNRFITGINVSSGNLYGTASDHKYSFITNDVVRMILTAEGNLGIGTPGPLDRLHIREDGEIGDPTTVMVLESALSKIPTLKFDEGSDLGMSIQYDGTGSGDNNKLHILNTIGNKAATFTNGGKMGIKETSPTEALDIDGVMVIDGGGAENELRFYEGSTVEAKLAYDGQILSLENSGFAGSVNSEGLNDSEIEGSGDILLDAADKMFFVTGPSTKGVLSIDGLFGINTTVPDGMFHVRAFDNTGAALRMENDNNTNHWSWRAKDDLLELHYNGAVVGSYNGSTGAYTVSSDRRLKENITALEDGVLAGINQMEPSYYYFKDDKTRKEKSIGFIAQDVLKIFPQVVKVPESEIGNYGISYSTIAVLAVKALQEQQKELDWLQEEIEKKVIMKEKINFNNALAEKLTAELASFKDLEVKE